MAQLRRVAGGLLALLVIGGLVAPVGAQTAPECMQPAEPTPEDFGPTDITAVTGNRRLSVGINDEGTVTVLRWPSPSYYDQIKYRTVDRGDPHMGSEPNEGAFVGLAWRSGSDDEWEFAWMRDAALEDAWTVSQRYADDDTDEVVTTYRARSEGLTIALRDVVASSRPVLVRRVTVTRDASSAARQARLFSFANFNPVFSKARNSPYGDWCAEERNDGGAVYDSDHDAVVAERSGLDESTGQPSSVALAMGPVETSSQHHVGQDSYETGGAGTSSYDDAMDGELTGIDLATGQADSAVAVDLDLSGPSESAAFVIAAGATAGDSTEALETARRAAATSFAREKSKWWSEWLKPTSLPRDAPAAVRTLAKRALISIRQAADPDGLIVGSVSTQPTFSLDWIRDGAYVNRALDAARHPELAEAHNRRYADLQSTAASSPPGGEATPPGNWSQNFYADGVVGGPIPYEIDETGLGLWTLWDHYVQTKDADYLLDVYESIQRGAQYLTDVCRDPSTGLQCAAPEGDNASPTQTLRGAQAVWLGLDAAARAALVKAELDPSGSAAADNAIKWRDRRDEVGDAIIDAFHDPGCDCFTEDPLIGGTFLWPARAIHLAGSAADDQADANWAAIRSVFANNETVGGMESQSIVGNAFTWSATTDRKKLKRALKWIATVPTTNRTGILGAAWLLPDEAPPSAVVTMQGQPHVPSLAMFYLAALKTYGAERWSPR